MHNLVSSVIKAKLSKYLDYLVLRQNRWNLVGKSTISCAWKRHVLDSVQLIDVAGFDENSQYHWLDIGSGAGFPRPSSSNC